ncbi:tetratricopeptide repeat protein [Lysobacter sp. A6]|uniref:Tetratricopeptide repeat protein n=1 Tax=Noviluteimonas lactosilytica TaxID=2888523 RepID=A0ABS8JJK6_9GAMM|nr:tetratricopeptide repeat protein [Lysobacter lactosilyticus]MCC8363779.1 tetratricopeptide repeat protein [Lysobacter lactosilyticus]
MLTIRQLRKRKVAQWVLGYTAVAWALLQGVGLLADTYGWSAIPMRVGVALSVLGFFLTLVIAWFQGERGQQKVTRLEVALIAIVVIVGGAWLWQTVQTTSEQAAADASPLVSAGIPTIEQDPSIAVLPLDNMSSGQEQQYFSDGISEELLNLLNKVPELRVIARTSSFAFKDQNLAVPEIARRLNVASILQGSVRRAGNRVRIAVQLVRATDGAQLWAETYDRDLNDIFQVQDEIAAAVVDELKIKLLKAPKVTPVDPRVYALILQAQALLDQQSKDGRAQALLVFKQALSIAPNEARAWAGLGRVYINQSIYSEIPPTEAAKLAREALNKALKIDPRNVIAITGLARLAADFDFDAQAAADYNKRALQIEPNNLVAINTLGILLSNVGRFDEALPLYDYRVAHDPANPTAYNNRGITRYYARQWDAAIDDFRTALRLSPAFVGARNGIAASLLAGKGDAAGALREIEGEPDEASRLQIRALAFFALGRTRESNGALQALIRTHGEEQPTLVALAYSYRVDRDAAFEWLDKAAAARDPAATSVAFDVLTDPLRDDPRWLPFLTKIGYDPEQLARVRIDVPKPGT